MNKLTGRNVCIVTYSYGMPNGSVALLSQVRRMINEHRIEVVAFIVAKLIGMVPFLTNLMYVQFLAFCMGCHVAAETAVVLSKNNGRKVKRLVGMI